MQQFTPSPPRRAEHVATRAAFSHRLGARRIAAALPEEERVLARWAGRV